MTGILFLRYLRLCKHRGKRRTDNQTSSQLLSRIRRTAREYKSATSQGTWQRFHAIIIQLGRIIRGTVCEFKVVENWGRLAHPITKRLVSPQSNS